MHTELSLFVLMIISYRFNPICSVTRRCFYCKNSFSGHSCSFHFHSHACIHTHTHTQTHYRGFTRSSIIFSRISLWLHTHWTLCCLIPAFMMLHVFFMKAQRVLEALSFVKRVSIQGQRKLSVYPQMWDGLITATAPLLSFCRNQYQKLTATEKNVNTAPRLETGTVWFFCLC